VIEQLRIILTKFGSNVEVIKKNCRRHTEEILKNFIRTIEGVLYVTKG